MHHAATSSSVHRSRWKALLGPLLLAEIGFTLLCLGAGALIWQASERRETENELARLQASHSVYARQLDTRLSTQQQHLRMLSRATRRVLVSAATQTRPARILTSDLPAVLSHDDVERVMTTLLDDYYAMDSLVSRLFVMPEGMRAFSVPEPLHETALPPYQRDATPQGTDSVVWWPRASSPEGYLVATRNVIEDGHYLARVGLEISMAQLQQLIRDEAGSAGEHWLVDAEGRSLMRDEATRVLPDAAGRYGMQWLEGRDQALLWDTLPSTGWRLVSRLRLPDDSAWQKALPWLSIGLIMGNVLIFAGFVMVLYWRMQREEEGWQAALAGLGGWLTRLGETPPSHEDTSYTTLETMLARLEPHLRKRTSSDDWDMVSWSGRLQLPALLTEGGMLVGLNPTLAGLMGERPDAFRGTTLSAWLAPRLVDDQRRRIRLTDARGDTREYRLECLTVQGEHTVWGLFDQADIDDTLHQLRVARDQAREDARLKSGYLDHLRQELESALTDTAARDDQDSPGTAALRKRLDDALMLLETLTERPKGPEAAAQESRPRVLVVDDGPVNTLLACSVLERQGCQVETATSGEEALALAEHQAFDLVFMDIYMPSLDGMETSRRWRRLERRLARGHASVLVALTANVTEAGREAFLQAGMDDCLAKPYRPGDLVAMVRRWLGTANPSDE